MVTRKPYNQMLLPRSKLWIPRRLPEGKSRRIDDHLQAGGVVSVQLASKQAKIFVNIVSAVAQMTIILGGCRRGFQNQENQTRLPPRDRE